MKTKHCVFLFFLTFVFLSCNQSGKEKLLVIDALKDIRTGQFAGPVDCFEDIRYVHLETNDSCRLPWKYEMTLVEGGNILVTTSEQCLLFDGQSGKLIRKIGKSGSGPSDYVFASNGVYNDKNQTIGFFGGEDKRILYSLTGEYLGTVQFESVGTLNEVNYLDSNTFCSSYENPSGRADTRILIFDRNGKTVRRFFNNKLPDGTYAFSEFGGFYHYQDSTYYKEILNDTIFRLTKNELIPHFILSIPDHTKASIVSVTESRNQILYAVSQNRMYYFTIYGKEKGETATVLSSVSGGTGFMQLNNDLPINISYVSPQGYTLGDIHAKDMLKFLKDNNLQNKYGYLSQLSETDNPVVVIAKLK